MSDRRVTVEPVETEAQRAELWALLEGFHAWMREHAPAYDPADARAADRRSLERDDSFRAWLARVDGEAAGCVVLYGLTDDLAEFGRLWVAPDHRGEGAGRRLTQTVVDEARERDYETLGLTTPPWSEAAHELYEALGFEYTAPYPETRLAERHHEDAIFMQRELASGERDG